MNSSRLFGIHAFLLLSLPGCIAAISEDRFNYRETVGNDYGPEAWDQVECDVVGECPGWPDGWELAVGWELTDNICRYCPASGNNCGLHSQSPIDLLRSPSTTGHDTECHDYHWMAYEDMSCQWHDIIKNGYTEEENNFRIRRHALQVLEPVDENGNLRCDNGNGKSAFPRLDYSKGFPNWWHLSHTEVTVPSEHFQEGKQYAAEVHLAHFYEINFERKMGKVAIFLDPDETKERWPFLDKLICQWREVEEKTRDECGLASVPPYPGCRNPTRGDGDTDLPYVDPYPFIDCDSVENSFRICKPTSCCEETRGTTDYCVNEVYEHYGDETPSMAFEVTSMPMQMVPPTLPFEPTLEPSMYVQITNGPVLSPPSPSAIPSVIETGQLVCSDYDFHDTINVNRICKDGGCCDPLRSATDYCHFVYDFFGDSMGSVCNNCCDPSKELAPAPPTHPVYPEIQCSSIDNPYRICKPTSCCEETASTTDYCNGVYELYGESMGSVCWYCCSMPKEVDTSVLVQWSRRELTSNSSEQDIVHGEVLLPHGATIGELHLDAANFVVNENLENDYLQGIEDYRQRRTEESKAASEAIHESTRRLTDYGTPEYNYPNVKYSPYEWLREVKTEYYFRYEGGQMVPPCFETVHYRVMKDPILIHPDQLAELERLLAWRIAPKGSEENECQPDSAGRERPGSHGNAVDLNRPLQGYSNIHRKVFCECQDWTSKFDEDKAWCQLDKDERWFKKPYNFNV
eukprot:Nitzschia sp. Nitz4//scaffold21_size171442//123870//126940//NITZ4_002181-RA/size171442-augustus-gene-0.206-mRNA-1//-1//CDS//3329542471//422//frame0